jgi:endonuclease G
VAHQQGWLDGLQPAAVARNATRPTPEAQALLDAAEHRLLPTPGPGCQLVQHSAFAVSYNEEHEQPEWAAWRLTAPRTRGTLPRPQRAFHPDPAVRTRTADYPDYSRSGYDRGHLVPNGDMRWDAQAQAETFLLSNICPQLHSFNDGVWRLLEEACRRWARSRGNLFIVTGPVLKPGLPKIGRQTQISVPTHFWKLVVETDGPDVAAIAFLIPHQDTRRPFMDFAITVDSLERVLGRDLLQALPDDVEAHLEAHLDPAYWR